MKVIYIPLIYMRDKGTYPPTRPTLWYFSWQCDVWDTFERCKIETIWKAGPRTSNLDDPMKYRKSKYIRYSTNKLSRELKKADFAIVDYPSTPMMEALRKIKPTLCMIPSWDEKHIRKEYKHFVTIAKYPNVCIVSFLKKEGVIA